MLRTDVVIFGTFQNSWQNQSQHNIPPCHHRPSVEQQFTGLQNMPQEFFFFLTRDRSSTKCPLRVHIAGHGSVTGPTLGMGLV